MPKYILDSIVENELLGIWHFIAQDNPDAATRVIESVYETFHALATNPGLGRVGKFKDPRLKGICSFRVKGFNNYLIFYRSIQEGIQVLHIYHGARNLESLLGEA